MGAYRCCGPGNRSAGTTIRPDFIVDNVSYPRCRPSCLSPPEAFVGVTVPLDTSHTRFVHAHRLGAVPGLVDPRTPGHCWHRPPISSGRPRTPAGAPRGVRISAQVSVPSMNSELQPRGSGGAGGGVDGSLVGEGFALALPFSGRGRGVDDEEFPWLLSSARALAQHPGHVPTGAGREGSNAFVMAVCKPSCDRRDAEGRLCRWLHAMSGALVVFPRGQRGLAGTAAPCSERKLLPPELAGGAV
jgi:hypothetical protein